MAASQRSVNLRLIVAGCLACLSEYYVGDLDLLLLSILPQSILSFVGVCHSLIWKRDEETTEHEASISCMQEPAVSAVNVERLDMRTLPFGHIRSCSITSCSTSAPD